jgi:hypothetical protein
LRRSAEAFDATTPPLPPDFIFLANAYDQSAIAKMRSASVGGLAIDRFVPNDPQLIQQLREALVEVYFRAAQFREMRKATKCQFDHARKAERHLTEAVKHLEATGTDGRDGLTRLLAGPRLDDAKGERETNRFGATCETIRLDIVRSGQALQFAIDAEMDKSGKAGERAKRLRTLVDALAAWWSLGGGKSIAPYVKANRRDDVAGRSGPSLSIEVNPMKTPNTTAPTAALQATLQDLGHAPARLEIRARHLRQDRGRAAQRDPTEPSGDPKDVGRRRSTAGQGVEEALGQSAQ